MPGPYFGSTYLPETIDQTFEIIPHHRDILQGFTSGTLAPPWNYDWSNGNPLLTSGNYFAFAPSVMQNFVEATVERVMALNWFNPASGFDLYGISRYFLPSSGNQPLNITRDYTNDYGWNAAFIQQIVYNIAKYYASCSGSYDSLIYPFGFTSGIYTTLGFEYYTYGTVPSGSEYFYQDYSFKPERYLPYPSGFNATFGGDAAGNPPSGNPLWPPPSGFTRIYPREVYDLRQSGYMVGQNARFIALINHNFNTDGLPEGLSGINHNGFFGGPSSIYTTPVDQRLFSNQIVKYMGLGSGWLPWDESQFGPTPNNPDLVMEFGLIKYGDYMGPWILNDLQTAINRLNRVCVIRSTRDINQLSLWNHSLYANSIWRASGVNNDKTIYIPFVNSSSLNPLTKIWSIFTNSTNIDTAWHNTIHSGSYSGVNFLQNPSIGGFGYEGDPSHILSSGIFPDVFYTKNFTVGPSGHYDFPTGYPGYFDSGSTLDFYDSIIDSQITIASGAWTSWHDRGEIGPEPPHTGPSGIPATVTFYWRGFDQLTAEDPFNVGSFSDYRDGRNWRPLAGISHSFGILGGSYEGVAIACRSAYLSCSGFLPQRKGFVSAYVYTEIINQGISGTYPSTLYVDPHTGASIDGYSSYKYGKYNPLGTNLKWRDWTLLANGIVGSGDVFNTPIIGDYSNPPSINILDDFPSGNSFSFGNFIHDCQGYEVTNWALVIDYAISGGFKYQGPIQDITYPSLSGLFGS